LRLVVADVVNQSQRHHCVVFVLVIAVTYLTHPPVDEQTSTGSGSHEGATINLSGVLSEDSWLQGQAAIKMLGQADCEVLAL
jgi:hypothetical protein